MRAEFLRVKRGNIIGFERPKVEGSIYIKGIIMAYSIQKNRTHLDNINLAFDYISVDDGRRIIKYLVGKLFEDMENPTMFAKVQSQFHALQAPPSAQGEEFLRGILVRPLQEETLWKMRRKEVKSLH